MRHAIVRTLTLICLGVACKPAASDDDAPATTTKQAVASPAVGAPVDSLDAAILEIRQRYLQVERDRPQYHCRTLSLDGFSAEGGELEACDDGAGLRKLTARYLGEGGRTQEELYLWNDHLDFAYRQTEHYSAPLSGTVKSREEDRFYFVGGRLVRWLGPRNVPQPVSSPDAQEESAQLQDTARQLAACARDASRDTCEA